MVEPFATKHGLMTNPREWQCHVKSFDCCCQRQGHGHSMRSFCCCCCKWLSRISSELRKLLLPTLVLLCTITNQSVVQEVLTTTFKVKVTVRVQILCVCPCLPDLLCWCIITRQRYAHDGMAVVKDRVLGVQSLKVTVLLLAPELFNMFSP